MTNEEKLKVADGIIAVTKAFMIMEGWGDEPDVVIKLPILQEILREWKQFTQFTDPKT